MLEWDGAKFVKVSDLLQADQARSSRWWRRRKEYADANAPWPTNEECKM